MPPQELLYHSQFAPGPRNPPTTSKVVFPPGQILEALEEMFPALADSSSTVIVTLTHAVVLQVPSARTK